MTWDGWTNHSFRLSILQNKAVRPVRFMRSAHAFTHPSLSLGLCRLFSLSARRFDVVAVQKALNRPIESTEFTNATSPKYQQPISEVPHALLATTLSTNKHGLLVASCDTSQAITALAWILPGGTRYESGRDLGTNQKESQLAIARRAELRGSSLNVTLTRDNLILASEFPRNSFPEVIETFKNMLISPSFLRHEMKDVRKQVELDSELAAYDVDIVLSDAIHSVAFRTGLGNPMITLKTDADRIEIDQIRHFLKSTLHQGGQAFIGVGINHETLMESCEANFDSISTKLTSRAHYSSAPYYGGELRVSADSPFNHAILAFEAIGQSSPSYPALCILREMLGTTSAVKYGESVALLPIIMHSLNSVAGDVEMPHLSTFLESHSDSGLFGIRLAAMPLTDMKYLLERLVYEIKSAFRVVPSELWINRAKAAAIFKYAEALEDRTFRLILTAQQVSACGKFMSELDFAKAVEKVSAKEIQQLGAKIFGGSPSMASYGRPYQIPYLDTLKL